MLQTGKTWTDCVVTKAIGGVNLDIATRNMPTVEHFVMFSSISAGIGNAGQTNYGYGNGALDELCQVCTGLYCSRMQKLRFVPCCLHNMCAKIRGVPSLRPSQGVLSVPLCLIADDDEPCI